MSTLPINKITDEVYVANRDIICLDQNVINFIKEKALTNSRGRVRICAHKDSQDSLHEMIIAMCAGSYIRPHRHRNKVESFHLIEGSAHIVIFSDDGDIEEVIHLSKEKHFFYRLNILKYHTLLIESALLVIHETTNGPFIASDSDYAEFSPPESDIVQSKQYISTLKEQIKNVSHGK